MTLQEIRESDTDFLTPKEVAEALSCDPYAINVQAKADPSKLGFPVCMIGTRVRIPRRGFLRWMEGGAPRAMTDEQVRAEFDRLRAWMLEQLEGAT